SPYLAKISNTYEYILWNTNQKCVVNDGDTIMLTIKDVGGDTLCVDGIKADNSIKVEFQYKTRSCVIDTLKSTLINDLLTNNEQLLSYLQNNQIAKENLVLVLDNDDHKNQQILTAQDDDFKRPIGDFLCLNSEQNEVVNFRIVTLITIIKYGHNDQQRKKMPVFDRNLTLREITNLNDDEYLANKNGMEIIDIHTVNLRNTFLVFEYIS
ncbi:unnamed protein product, partial [Didymodactylos carnosus]